MTRNWRLGLAGLLLTLACGASPQATWAATTTTTFGVSATVQASCTITAAPLDFGIYLATVGRNSTAALTVRCSNTAPWDIGLSPGTAPGATVSTRRMSGPAGAFLDYRLATDGSGAVNWGQTPGVNTVTGVGTGADQEVIVYGSVLEGQTVAPGVYTDTITATITF